MSGQPKDATEIARAGTISEQNKIIAEAYEALLIFKPFPATVTGDQILKVNAAIDLIEEWRQKRDPAETRR